MSKRFSVDLLKTLFLGAFLVVFCSIPLTVSAQQPDMPTSPYHVVAFSQNVSIEDGRSIVERYDGDVQYVLPLTNLVVAEISKNSRQLLIQSRNVLWIEEQRIAEEALMPVLLAQESGSNADSAQGNKDEGVDVFILDSGAGGESLGYSSAQSLVPLVGVGDKKGHGAGVARAFREVAGEDPNIRLHSIKVSAEGMDGASEDLLAEGIQSAIRNGAEVINISYSRTYNQKPISEALKKAYDDAESAGVAVVVAAGNDGGEQYPNQLAVHHPNILSVGALDRNGVVADYSDGQTVEDKADVFALGDLSVTEGVTFQGTSYAAPRIAAVVARIKQEPVSSFDIDNDGIWDAGEIRARINQGIKTGEFESLRNSDEVVPTTGRRSAIQGNNNQELEITSPTNEMSPTPITVSPGTPRSSPPDTAPSPTPQPAAKGLVPCSGPDCQACDLVTLADNIIDFFVTAVVILATLLFVYAGFLYLTAAPNPAQIDKAHKIFWNVFIGLVIVLAAWLIVDIIMKVLFIGDLRSLGPWNDIPCVRR